MKKIAKNYERYILIGVIIVLLSYIIYTSMSAVPKPAENETTNELNVTQIQSEQEVGDSVVDVGESIDELSNLLRDIDEQIT